MFPPQETVETIEHLVLSKTTSMSSVPLYPQYLIFAFLPVQVLLPVQHKHGSWQY